MWEHIAVGASLGLTAVLAHTLGITLPFYRRVCPVCNQTGWAKCDRATHEKQAGEST